MNNTNPVLELKLKSFAFPKSSKVLLQDVFLTLGRTERVAVIGASASGKTTLLKICAGLSKPDTLNGTCARSGELAMLFQDNVLLDYLSVRDNIILPSRLRRAKVDLYDIAQSLKIERLLDAYPRRLSGGERKRVALARALAYPDLAGLIMDEPFVGLDLSLKESILVDLRARLLTAKLAVLFSTHSPEEAVYLADRIILLGGNPSTVIRSLPINLLRSNGAAALQEEAFQRLVFDVVSVMRSMNLSSSL